MENKMINKETKSIIISAILLVVGILLCFSTTMGIDALSIIIGALFIISGIFSVINSALKKKSVMNYTCILSAILVAFGIFFIEYKLATIIFFYVPWLLIVLGVIIILDAVLNKISQNNTTVFITELIIGIGVLALGLCLKFIPGFIDLSSVMLGIVMIVYGVYLLIMTFSKSRT